MLQGEKLIEFSKDSKMYQMLKMISKNRHKPKINRRRPYVLILVETRPQV
jgi:hypothetical protein